MVVAMAAKLKKKKERIKLCVMRMHGFLCVCVYGGCHNTYCCTEEFCNVQ